MVLVGIRLTCSSELLKLILSCAVHLKPPVGIDQFVGSLEIANSMLKKLSEEADDAGIDK